MKSSILISMLLLTVAVSSHAELLHYRQLPSEPFPTFSDNFPRHAFSLPTINPRMFGFIDAVGINFDFDTNGHLIAAGTAITNQYESLGVLANGPVTGLYNDQAFILDGGTPPNGIGMGYSGFPSGDMVFTFITPVQAFGFINLSPDGNRVDVYDGPNGTGNLLTSVTDRGDFTSDEFIAAYSTGDEVIRSFVIRDVGGPISAGLDIDELVFGKFAPVPVPLPNALGLLGLGLLSILKLRRKSTRR